MPRPIHFEITAENTDRCIKFYETCFGWKFQKWDGPMPYWMIMTGEEGPGINGGMMPRQDHSNTVNTMGVQNLDESVKVVEQNGGKVAMPKMAVPGIGWLAYCMDSEGTLFGMMQDDPTAA